MMRTSNAFLLLSSALYLTVGDAATSQSAKLVPTVSTMPWRGNNQYRFSLFSLILMTILCLAGPQRTLMLASTKKPLVFISVLCFGPSHHSLSFNTSHFILRGNKVLQIKEQDLHYLWCSTTSPQSLIWDQCCEPVVALNHIVPRWKHQSAFRQWMMDLLRA